MILSNVVNGNDNKKYLSAGFMESKINTLQTDSSGEDPQGNDGCVALYPMQDSLRLLDAHFIFQPLLSSLGVMSRQLVNTVTGSSKHN